MEGLGRAPPVSEHDVPRIGVNQGYGSARQVDAAAHAVAEGWYVFKPHGTSKHLERKCFGAERPRTDSIDQSSADLPSGRIAHHHGEVLPMP